MATPQVTSGALIACSHGSAPGIFSVLPINRVSVGNLPVAMILDNKPMLNVPPFGMCQSLANPVVATATAAALGALTPMPCVPVLVAPWEPGTPTVTIGNLPAVDCNCRLYCAWAGTITILQPAQASVTVP